MGISREPVPGIASRFVKRVVIDVGPVGEVVAFQVEPGQLHGIQLGRVGRQWNEGDVGRHAQRSAAMPARVVQHQHDLHVWRYGAADLGEMQIHARRVAGRHDPTDRLAGSRTGGAEQIDPLVLRLSHSAGTRAPRSPDMGQRALLPEAALILEPDFEALVRVALLDFGKRLREVFLYAA